MKAVANVRGAASFPQGLLRRTMLRWNHLRGGFALCIGALFFGTPLAIAQTTYTWGTTPGTGNWATNTNWAGSVTPLSSTGSLLAFGTSSVTTLTDNIAAGSTFGSLTFNSGASAYTIGGNSFTLNGVTAAITNNSSNLETINNAITLGQAQTWAAASGSGGLTFGGTVANGGNTLTLDSSAAITLSNIISGTGGLVVAQTSPISGSIMSTLSGVNTYQGGTTVNRGMLNISNAAALGTGAVVVNGSTSSPAQLQLSGVTVAGQALTLSGWGLANTIGPANGDGALRTLGGAGAAGWTGNIQLTGATDVNFRAAAAGDLTISGSVTSLANQGINAGGGGNTTFSGALALGTGNLTKMGSGTVTLSNTTNSFGNTIISAGTLAVTTSTGTLGTTGSVTLNDGNSGASASALLIGASGITVDRNITVANQGSGTSTIGGSIASGTGTFSGAVALNRSAEFLTNGTSNITFGGVISGEGAITKNGTGTLTLNGTNTFAGGLTAGNGTVTGGTVNINNASALGTGTFTVGNTTTVDNTSGAPVTITNAQAWNGNLTFTGTNNLTMNTGAITLGANQLLTTTGGNLIVGSAIGGAFSLTKVGAGTLTLNGADTFSGGFTSGNGTVTGGTVNINNAAALGTGTFMVNNTTTLDNTSGAPVTITNAQAWNADITFTGTNNLTMGNTTAGNIALGISKNLIVSGGNLIVAGNITGLGTLTKVGAGALTLSGTNTYAGLTAGNSTVAGGTVNINSAGALGTTFTVGNTTTIDNTSGTTKTVTATGAVVVNNTANLTYAGTNNNNLTLSGGVTLGWTPTVTVTQGTLALSGIIAAGANGITKAGNGTLELSGVNLNTGVTTLGAIGIPSGTLRATTSAALGTGAASLVLNSGNLQLANDTGLNFARNTTVGGTTTITSDRLTAGNGVTHTLGTLSINGSILNVAAGGNVTGGTAGLTFGAVTLNAGSGATFAPAANTSLTVSTVGTTVTNSSFTVNGAGNMTISAAINAGTGNIVKSGTGSLTLSAANTYSGGTTLNAGTLTLGNNGSLGTGVLTAAGGNLDVTGVRAVTNALTFSSGASLKFLGTSTLSLSGAVTLSGANTINVAASTMTLTNAIGGGTASLTKTGAGTLSLAPTVGLSSTFTGGVIVNGGTLNLNYNGLAASTNLFSATNTLTLGGGNITATGKNNAASVQTFASTTINPGASAVTLTRGPATGTLALTAGAISRPAGSGSTLAAGTVDFNLGAGTSVATSSSNATITGSGWITLNNRTDFAQVTTGNLAIFTATNNTFGAGIVNNVTTAFTLAGINQAADLKFNTAAALTNNLGGFTLTLNSGGILETATQAANAVAINNGTLKGASGADLVIIQGAATNVLNIGAVIADNTSATGLTKSGLGTLTLSGVNTYTGVTTLNSGTLRATTSAQALGTGASALVVNGGTLQLANDTGLNFGRNTSMTADATFTADRITSSTTGVTHTLGTLSLGANTLNVARGAAITGAGVGGITFGATTLTATGATFTPAANTALTLGSVSGTNTDFTVNGAGTTTITGAVATGTGGINYTPGAATSNLTLFGVNTYSGNTTVNTTVTGGTLAIGGTTALQNSTLDITGGNGATISFVNGITAATLGGLNGNNTTSLSLQNGGSAVTLSVGNNNNDTAYSGILTGTGSLTKLGTGQLTLSGANSYTGTTTLSAGTLTVASTGALSGATAGLAVNAGTLNLNNSAQTVASLTSSAGGGTINLGTGHTLTVNGAGTDTFSGVIAGAGGLTKSGAGSLTFGGLNTQTGTTTLTAGTLTVNSTGSLSAATANLVVNTGSTLNLNNSAQTIANLSGTGGQINLGANHNLTVNGAANSTWTGNMALTAGPATITSGSNLVIIGDGTNFTTNITLGGNTLTFNTGGTPAIPPAQLVPGLGPYMLDPTNILVNSKITGAGGITKNGPGTLTLIPVVSSDFTGNLTVNDGKVIVAGLAETISLAPSNIVIGVAGSTNATNSAGVQIGQNQTGAYGTANIIGARNLTSGYSPVNLTVYENGVLNMNSGANGFANITLQGGHIDGGNATTSTVITANAGITTLSSNRTAIIDNGDLSMYPVVATGNFTFNVAASAGSGTNGVDLRIADVVQNGLGYTGGAGAATNLVKTGLGTMVLTGSNQYLGNTVVSQGILNIQNNLALGANGGAFAATGNGTIVSSGAQLQLQGGISVGNITTPGDTLTLNGLGYNNGVSNDNTGALLNYSGNNTYGGQILVGSSTRINSTTGNTLTLAVPGGGTIINNPSGTNTLTFGGSGNIVVNDSITNTGGTLALTKDGSGTLTLAGANAGGYSGGLNITSGYVKTTNNSGLNGATSVTSGASLQLAGNITTAPGTTTLRGDGVGGNTTNFSGTSAALENLAGNNTFNGAIALGANASIKTTVATDTLTFSNGASVDLASASHNALTVGGAGNVTFSGTASVRNGNATATAGTTPSGNTSGNTYSVITSAPGTGGALNKIDGGTLTIAGSGTSQIDSLSLSGGSMVVGGTATVLSGPITVANSTTLTINSGSSTAGGLVTFSNTALGASTINGALAGTGTLQFDGTTAGGGKLVFNQSFSAPSLTLLVTGGELDLRLGANVTFGTIKIVGNTILDFDSSSATTLTSTNLIIDAGVSIDVRNWASETDFWYSNSTVTGANHNTSGMGGLGQITFNGTGFGAASTTWIQGPWPGYTDREIRPVPEPATYGAVFFSGCLALLGYRRLRRRN